MQVRELNSGARRAVKRLAGFCLAGLVTAGLGYGAVLTQVGTRAGLAGDDYIEWGTSGDEGNTPASPYNVTSGVNGLAATATLPAGTFLILVEGSGAGGNFAIGDVLLTTNFQNGPIRIQFATAVAGGGLQIQRNDFGAFTGTITAFGAGNVNFGSFNVAGNSTGAQDNSAIFLGLTSDLQDIVALEFDVTNAGGSSDNSFLVNRLEILTQGPEGPPVPEPSSYLLALPALALLLAAKRNRA